MVVDSGINLLPAYDVAGQAICLGASLFKDRVKEDYWQKRKGKWEPKFSAPYWLANWNYLSIGCRKQFYRFMYRRKDFPVKDLAISRPYAVEQLAVWLWALGRLDKKPLIEVSFSENELYDAIPFTSHLGEVLDHAELRSRDEMLQVFWPLAAYGERAAHLFHGSSLTDFGKRAMLDKAVQYYRTGFFVSPPPMNWSFTASGFVI